MVNVIEFVCIAEACHADTYMYCMQLQNVSMLADDIETQQKLCSEMLTPDKRFRRSPGTALRSPSSTASSCSVGILQYI